MRIILFCLFLSGMLISCKQKGRGSYFSDFPVGYEPAEIGRKLGYHFISGEHFLHGTERYGLHKLLMIKS